nr:MAG TPA: hypothetical protein [Caudoviricetes sp.]
MLLIDWCLRACVRGEGVTFGLMLVYDEDG